MYHLATTLIAGIIATVLASGSAFVPTPAEAAKLSNAERVALEKATAACKEEAKGMKFKWHWRKRQKYVQNCIIRAASDQGIDIWEIRRAVNMKELPSEEGPPKAQICDADHRRARRCFIYPSQQTHTYWKKGIRHDLDLGPHGCCALYRPRHARCAVVNLHSGLKGHREQLSPVRRGPHRCHSGDSNSAR